MARPTKLNPVLARKICKAVQEGVPPETAAVAAGVTAATYYSWTARGRQGERPFLEFLEAVTEAGAKFRAKLARTVSRAGAKGWQAALACLERRDPKHWRRKDRLEHTGKGGGPVLTRELSDEELSAIAAGGRPGAAGPPPRP